MVRTVRLGFAAALISALAACGGGGGGGTPAPVVSTSTFQVKQTYTSTFIQTPSNRNFTFTIARGQAQATGSGTLRLSPLSVTTFEGQTAQSQQEQLTFNGTANGQQFSETSTGTVFYSNNLDPIGAAESDSYSVATLGTIPATARVGDTGVFYVADTFTNSSKTTRTGSVRGTFSMDPDTASTAILRLTFVHTDTTGAEDSRVVRSFRIFDSGVIQLLTIAGNSSDGTNVTLLFQ